MNRLAQLALRIEHELARDDHAFAWVKAAQNLKHVVLRARAEHHCARLEPASVERNKYRVLLAASQHGGIRHQQHRRFQLRLQLDRGKHSGLEEITRVVKFHAHTGRAGLLIHGRINISDPPAEFAVRQVGQADHRFLSEPDKFQVLFVNLRLHPYDRQVGQPVELHTGLHHLAFDNHLLHYDSVARRGDPQALLRLPGFFQLRDLVV